MASTELAQEPRVSTALTAARNRLGVSARAPGRVSGGRGHLGLSHWLLPVIVAVVVALFVELIYALVDRNAAGRGIFVGQFWAPHDVAQYIAAMNDGAAGSFLIKDRLTSEPHGPVLIYPFYVLLGKITAALGLDATTGYRLAAVVGRTFMLLSIYAATSLVSPARSRRRLAFVLAAFGGGVIGVVQVLKSLMVPILGPFDLPVSGRDLIEPELGTFLVTFASPHLMVGMGLLMLAALAYVRAWRSRGPCPALAAVSLTLLLGFVNSYSLGTLCPVVCAHAAVMTIVTRRFIWRGIVAAILVNLATLPLLGYGVLTFVVGVDPFWGVAYGRQNVTPSPAPLDVVVSLGLILALAVVAIPVFARRITPGRLLVMTWIAVSLVLMYLPVGVQRRFAFGIQPMLAMLAAFGLPLLWQCIRSWQRPLARPMRPVATLLLLQMLFGSSLMLVMTAGGIVAQAGAYDPDQPVSQVIPAGLVPAGAWLADRVSVDDVVLGDPMTGNYLVRAMPGRVYAGHWSATVDARRKGDEIDWLLAAPFDEPRRAFLVEHGIRYVVIGPHERRETQWTASAAPSPGLALVYDRDGVAIFEVERP